jgi:hypothetical protein
MNIGFIGATGFPFFRAVCIHKALRAFRQDTYTLVHGLALFYIPRIRMRGSAMSDQALKNAETKRNQLIDRKKALLKEQAEIDDSINRIDRFIRDWHAFAGDSVPVDDGDTSISVDTETESKSTAMHRARPKPKNPKKEDVAEEARNIIHARGEPVMRG